MLHRARCLLLGLALAAVAPRQVPAQQPVPAGSFTAAQRAEIVSVLHSALKNDPSILRDAVLALQQDQQASAAAASSQAIAAHHSAIFDDAADPVAGNPHGRVTLVEFFDLRCPYCRRMRPDIDTLLAQDSNVRLVLKDLPVLGPDSVLGARALLAARAQGGYLKLQQALMTSGVALDEPTIKRAAADARLNWPALRQAMNDPAITGQIDANLKLATVLGIQGTPALIVGNQLVAGAMTLTELKMAVARLQR